MNPDRLQSVNKKKKANYWKRVHRIQEQFNLFHNEKRIRMDDVIKLLADHWCVTATTIHTYLSMRIPSDFKKKGTEANQSPWIIHLDVTYNPSHQDSPK